MNMDLHIEEKDIAKHVLSAASEFGCSGLLAGQAIQFRTGNRVSARSVQKEDGPFLCPKCRLPAVVHKDRGSRRLEHFAHNAPLSPIIPHGETETHYAAKNEICTALTSLWPEGNWEVERTIKKIAEKKKPELRPDISGYIGTQRLVIEVQWSTLSVATILKRSLGYLKWKTPVLWVLPLLKPLTGEFRPRSFERYLHSMYYGRVYYWHKGDGINVTPTHFVPVQRWVPTREWTDSEGEREAGGYPKKLRLLKTALEQEQISIPQSFYLHTRPEFSPTNGERNVPQLCLWQDKLPIWWDKESEDTAEEEWDKEDALDNPYED